MDIPPQVLRLSNKEIADYQAQVLTLLDAQTVDYQAPVQSLHKLDVLVK